MLPIPIIQPLRLALGSDLSLAQEQLCHWRVRMGGRQKSLGGKLLIWIRSGLQDVNDKSGKRGEKERGDKRDEERQN